MREIQTSVSENKGKGHINADGVCGFFAKSTKSIGPGKNSKPLHPKSLVLYMVEERAFPTQMPLPSNGHGQLKSEFIKQLGKFSEEPSIHLHLIGKKMKKSPLTGILSIFGKTKKQRTRNIHVTLRSKGSDIRIYLQLRLHIYGSYIFRIYIRRRLGLTEVWDTFGGEDGCTIWGGVDRSSQRVTSFRPPTLKPRDRRTQNVNQHE